MQLSDRLKNKLLRRWCVASRLESDADGRIHRGRMALLRFCLPHESTGKIPTHKAALTAFGAGVCDCICCFAASVADAAVCAWAALARAL